MFYEDCGKLKRSISQLFSVLNGDVHFVLQRPGIPERIKVALREHREFEIVQKLNWNNR